MSKANAEQLLAIEHSGGVLLKAGAGSGKTFVLVEHILYLTKLWIKEFQASPQGTFEEMIRQKFSQVVMMTFTKKAAGEMSIRLSDKFAEMAQQDEFWKTASEAFPYLTVTTIDGFCRRLITAGYFPHLSTEAKIIFNAERLDQVKILFERWFETHSESLAPEFLEIVVREKKQLLSAFSSVFSDPGLRLVWKTFDLSEAHPDKLGALLDKSFKLSSIECALSMIHKLDLPSENDRSAFEKMVAQFQACGLPVVDSVEKLNLYSEIFNGIKRLIGESGKKKSPLHEEAKEGISLLRDWIRAWSPLIKDYSLHYDEKVLPWMKLCRDIFHNMEKGLDPNQGMTFGDIEYYVALGLQEPDLRERIQKIYSYFIVDEFQDTSALQFRIINDLIGGDFNKLFCVGDPKQAIYGFRGGELSVFQDCSELVPQVRTLANNYRSLPQVIHFNNSLFQSVLPAGQEFEGLDPFSVSPEDQNVPLEVSQVSQGEIEVLTMNLNRNVEELGKYTTDELNAIEAKILADSIASERTSKPDETCTVLYRKLKPSSDLIRELIYRNVGFTAQYKIDLLDDPIMGMFLILLRRQFDESPKTRDKYPLFMFGQYLEILSIDFSLKEESLVAFDQDLKFWGLLEAFKKFLFRLNITNENADINLSVIATLCKLYHQDPESILVQLQNGDNPKASLDFRYGTHAEKVQIMTAHASKGLEFENVYLGGIYTNGKENPDRDMFGDHPASFYWYLDLSQRDKQKSPFYHFESELSKYKNFSESKRLFYVAATRAKKKLIWVDFPLIKDFFSVPKNSWIDGFSYWLNSTQHAQVLKNLKITQLDSVEKTESDNGAKSPQLPLFFYDSVGVFPRASSAVELGITSELSVTRLNSLVDCPRKFYLENVLKLDATPVTFSSPRHSEDHDEIKVISSSERGTMIHALIAEGLEKNFIVPRSAFQGEHHVPIEWALNLLKTFSTDFNFVAEKPLKFKFFNFMISGIPDLLLMPKNDSHSAQVWDFKTGRITQESLNHYWIQLKVYAYALYQLNLITRDHFVDLKLCFVDQQKILEERISFDTIRPELFALWKSQNEPWMIKTDHCAQCSYGDICPR